VGTTKVAAVADVEPEFAKIIEFKAFGAALAWSRLAFWESMQKVGSLPQGRVRVKIRIQGIAGRGVLEARSIEQR